MAYLFAHHKKALVFGFFILGSLFLLTLRPVDPGILSQTSFEVRSGDSFWQIISGLHSAGLIRSSVSTGGLAILRGQVRSLKPGRYELSPKLSSIEILDTLEGGSKKEVVVIIPEGASLYEIDHILSSSGVLGQKTLLPLHVSLEGYLFPDTYRFFTEASSSEVLTKFKENFETQTKDILPGDPREARRILILASLIEKEVPNPSDGRVVAGILEKRLKEGMPLQIDATLCYAKLEATANKGLTFEPCNEVLSSDKEIKSAYNTYKNRGLPPGPIGSPSLWAIQAALAPQSSPYWFYISDSKTKKTIFARTLEEQSRNIARYLR